MSAATAQRQAPAADSSRRLATIERLATICGLLSCWRRGLPRADGAASHLAPADVSESQVAMRAIGELLHAADLEYSSLQGDDRPALALLFAWGLAATIEASLWHMAEGSDSQAIPRGDLDAAALQVHRYVGHALRWCADGLQGPGPAPVAVTVPEGGAA